MKIPRRVRPGEVEQKQNTSASIIPFHPLDATVCVSCELPMKRKFNESWRCYCGNCYRWRRAYCYSKALARLIRNIAP